MSREDGAVYERLAAEHLEKKGWTILARNFTAKVGELDLVARDGETVVFVEVRQRSSLGFGTPAETIGRSKIRKLIKTAQFFAMTRGLEDEPMRFDVVAFDGEALEHIEDAFQAS